MADTEGATGTWIVKHVPLGPIPLVACERRRVILVNAEHPPESRCAAVRRVLDSLRVADDEWVLLDAG